MNGGTQMIVGEGEALYSGVRITSKMSDQLHGRKGHACRAVA